MLSQKGTFGQNLKLKRVTEDFDSEKIAKEVIKVIKTKTGGQ